jgi:hypothetical protein
LYEPGSLEGFVDRLLFIRSLMEALGDPSGEGLAAGRSAARQLDWVRHAARVQVRNNFDRGENLKFFGDLFMQRIAPQTECLPDENLVLQQI